jgi:acetyltransferase
MSENPLLELMNPGSIAFYGASNSPLKFGTHQFLNLVKGGYKGRVYPIHRTEKEVLGVPAYPTIGDVPETPDLVQLVIPTEAVPEALEQCCQKGIKRAVVVSAGFAEMGPYGRSWQERVDEVAARYGLRYMGPNCIGIINSGLGLNTTWFAMKYPPGGVGIASQSGTFVTQVLHYFEKLGLGLSQAISVGNQANIDITEAVEYLGQDQGTRAIAVYLEGVRDGRRLFEVARKITPHKPIVAFYVGGTAAGGRASTSHTAALAGSDALHDGMFKQAGIIRAKNFSEMFDFALALANQPLPAGPRLGVMTNSGGPGVAMAHECDLIGLEVPLFDEKVQAELRAMTVPTAQTFNPVDITVDNNIQAFFTNLPRAILARPELDGMLFWGILGPIHFRDKVALSDGMLKLPVDSMMDWLEETVAEFVDIPRQLNKPILAGCFAGREDEVVRMIQDGGVPVYPTPERAVRAMAAMVEYRRIRQRSGNNG